MSYNLKIPKKDNHLYRKAKEKQLSLLKKGVSVSMFDLIMEERKEKQQIKKIFEAFKL